MPSKPASRKKQSLVPVKARAGCARAIEHTEPQEADDGRYRSNEVVGETIIVEADLFADGHDVIGAFCVPVMSLARKWLDTPLRPRQ